MNRSMLTPPQSTPWKNSIFSLPKRNRPVKRTFDHRVYKQRHLTENAFGKIKRRRGLATRYCKRAVGFKAAIQIRCVTLWLHIL